MLGIYISMDRFSNLMYSCEVWTVYLPLNMIVSMWFEKESNVQLTESVPLDEGPNGPITSQ